MGSKMLKKYFPGIGLVGCTLVLSACIPSTGRVEQQNQQPAFTAPATVAIANPASVACVNSGGRLEIKTLANGSQIGMCHTRDGRTCEEWALYHNGICRPE